MVGGLEAINLLLKALHNKKNIFPPTNSHFLTCGLGLPLNFHNFVRGSLQFFFDAQVGKHTCPSTSVQVSVFTSLGLTVFVWFLLQQALFIISTKVINSPPPSARVLKKIPLILALPTTNSHFSDLEVRGNPQFCTNFLGDPLKFPKVGGFNRRS